MKNILVIVLITSSFFSCTPKENTGFIKMGELFEAFQLKKELTTQLQQTVSVRNQLLDSMKLDLEMMVVAIQGGGASDSIKNSFVTKKQVFLKKQEQFEMENTTLKQQYDHQIWTQLNEFIESFGKEKGLDYVFGANGSGAIMYGKDTKNVTQEAIDYVNQKYVGK